MGSSFKPATRINNLPVHTTPFIGRAQEVVEISHLLLDPACRLLTLSGPGGIGKTRLALQAAMAIAEQFPAGVCFVSLQAVTAPELLATVIAQALNLPPTGHKAPALQLLDYLQDQALLLLLDNFEQLLVPDEALNQAEALLIDLLEAAPRLKLLVTSREILNLQEEWLYPVQGLAFPPSPLLDEGARLAAYSAVQLFEERARRVRHDFSLAAELAGVIRICQLVEGMPLAIELAASWVKTLPCAEIAAEIERHYDFLATGLRNIPERQRSIRAVFEHCWQRLSEKERVAFRRLSVFQAGFRREAAEWVAGASLPVLSSLVDKSLLRRQPGDRYQIHGLLRQFGTEQLVLSAEEGIQVYDDHCHYFANFLHERLEEMRAGRQRQAILEIKAELENVRAAWQWAVQLGKIEEIQKSAQSLIAFYQFQSRYLEGLETFEKAGHSLAQMELAPEGRTALAEVLVYQAWFCIRLGRFKQARAVLARSRNLFAGQKIPQASSIATDPLLPLAVLAVIQGEYSEALRLAEEAHRLSEAQSNAWNLIHSFYALTNATLALGDYEAAGRYAQEAYARAEAARDRWFMAYLLNNLGEVARLTGNNEQAKHYYQASYTLRNEFEDGEGMAVALNHLGQVALRQKAYPEAEQLYGRSLAIYREINDKGGLAIALTGLGSVACASGQHSTAQYYYLQALQIATEIGFIPLTLSILSQVAELLLQLGRPQPGAELLSFIRQHPASDYETSTRAQQLLERYALDLPPETGSPGSLEAAIQQVQSELAAPIQAETEGQGNKLDVTWPPSQRLGSAALIEPLTSRELEILRLIAGGLSNPEIAEALIITVGTVKAHTHRIYGKLNATNRVQAIARATEFGLL